MASLYGATWPVGSTKEESARGPGPLRLDKVVLALRYLTVGRRVLHQKPRLPINTFHHQ